MGRQLYATEMKRGQNAVVSGLDTDNDGILRKLMSVGLLPGADIKAIRTFPSYVFQIGYTQIAVDKTVASVIMVEI